MSRRQRQGGRKRSLKLPIFLGLIAVTIVVAYLIFNSSGSSQSSPLIGTPVSPAIMNDLTGVSPSTLAAVGHGPSTVNSPSTISGAALSSNGKPEVLYVGGEYCPYCAAERWAMIVALSKFGNFTGVQYMQSSSDDVYPNTSTFTFVQASYTSNYITLVTVEEWDRAENVINNPTPAQNTLIGTYDSGDSIPFIDFGNQYVIMGAQYPPTVLRVDQGATATPYNWTQIASQVNNSSSIFAQNIDGAANRLISVICVLTSNNPSNVCGQPFAQTLAYMSPVGSSYGMGQPMVVVGDAPSALSRDRTPL